MKNQSAFNEILKKPLSDLAKDALDDFVDVLASQFRLFRVEMAADVSDAAKGIGRIAIFLPIIAVGYIFAVTGLALWLSRWTGAPMAFAGVGAIHLAVGGVGAIVSVSRLKRVTVLPRTDFQISRTLVGIKDGMSGAESSTNRVIP